MDLFSRIPCLEDEKIILRQMTEEDEGPLAELCASKAVYRYLPTFLYEQQEPDKKKVIEGMYTECIRKQESIHLGIYKKNEPGQTEAQPRFCGIAEIYNYEPEVPKVSIGYRLLENCWGQGIATRAVKLLTDHLMNEAEILVITAHVMTSNPASARVLEKNRYRKRIINILEDWGFDEQVRVDKFVYKEEYFK